MRLSRPTVPSGSRTRSDVSEKVWTVREALDWTRGYLESHGDERPRVSAEWLLSAATGLSRVETYAFGDRPLSLDERALLRDAVRRRAAGEPLQYVVGEVAFRHIVVRVEPGVLIPRPETEVLVDEALRGVDAAVAARGEARVLDLCTGSGCIAASIAFERPETVVFATDIDPVAVAVASANVDRLGLSGRVSVVESDLAAALSPSLAGTFDVVVSNPPYIPTRDLDSLPAEVARFEPRLALDGGPDGLSVFLRIAEDASSLLRPGGTLTCELDENRVCAAAEKCVEWYQEVRVVRDLVGRDRIVTGILPE